MAIYALLKGRAAALGEIHQWKGGPARKTEQGWKRVRKVGGRGRRSGKEIGHKEIKKFLGKNLYQTGNKYHSHPKLDQSHAVIEHVKGNTYNIHTGRGIHRENVEASSISDISKHYTSAKNAHRKETKKRQSSSKSFTSHVKKLKSSLHADKQDSRKVEKSKKKIQKIFDQTEDPHVREKMKTLFARHIDKHTRVKLGKHNQKMRKKMGLAVKIPTKEKSVPKTQRFIGASQDQRSQLIKRDKKLNTAEFSLTTAKKSKPPKSADTREKKKTWREKQNVIIQRRSESVKKLKEGNKKYQNSVIAGLPSKSKPKDVPEDIAGRLDKYQEEKFDLKGKNPTLNDLSLYLSPKIINSAFDSFQEETVQTIKAGPVSPDIDMKRFESMFGNRPMSDSFYKEIASFHSVPGGDDGDLPTAKEIKEEIRIKENEEGIEAMKKKELSKHDFSEGAGMYKSLSNEYFNMVDSLIKSDMPVMTGKRGGRYYLVNGNKVYPGKKKGRFKANLKMKFMFKKYKKKGIRKIKGSKGKAKTKKGPLLSAGGRQHFHAGKLRHLNFGVVRGVKTKKGVVLKKKLWVVDINLSTIKSRIDNEQRRSLPGNIKTNYDATIWNEKKKDKIKKLKGKAKILRAKGKKIKQDLLPHH